MWFIILLFLILAVIGVMIRSPKMLVSLAFVFSFIGMLYTPWFPILLIFFGAVGYIYYLDNRDKKRSDEKDFMDAVKRDIQEEVEIGSMLKSMRKHDQRMKH